jgi:hypothetical protein
MTDQMIQVVISCNNHTYLSLYKLGPITFFIKHSVLKTVCCYAVRFDKASDRKYNDIAIQYNLFLFPSMLTLYRHKFIIILGLWLNLK